ncbi:MAG: phospho-N-acetylmuramoyl-pentapeptide-transferase [Solitalea-like symbiont of Acarus siro]
MLYFLFEYLKQKFDLIGAGLFHYISFRTALAVIMSLYITTVFGKSFIKLFLKYSVKEPIRALDLGNENIKAQTPTMGGILIIISILIPTLLLVKIDNPYILLMLFTTVEMGLVGFIDDYIKVFKKNKDGLPGKYKIIGQSICGLVVGLVMYYHPGIVVKENIPNTKNLYDKSYNHTEISSQERFNNNTKSLKTNVPFFKNNQFDYSKLLGTASKHIGPLLFIIAVIIIVIAVSNGANITDGMDGLLAGSASIILSTLGVLAYISGNWVFADYLNIFYIPDSGELMIFAGAFMGATIGFLWYNTYPAQIFMGDTGSLMIGSIIAVFAIIIRKELLLPILCGVFLIESLSIIIQVLYFKYTKRMYGQGRRIFLMAPLHHHFQKNGIHESKIVTRFWIIGFMLAVISIVTLKIR